MNNEFVSLVDTLICDLHLDTFSVRDDSTGLIRVNRHVVLIVEMMIIDNERLIRDNLLPMRSTYLSVIAYETLQILQQLSPAYFDAVLTLLVLIATRVEECECDAQLR